AAAGALAHQRGVAAAEADGVIRLDFVPNDPLYLSDPYSGLGEWGLRTTRVDRAWDLVRGSPDVIVATVDTGVDANHPDLLGALLTPAQTLRNAGTSGCAISPVDDNSHGTHVAGIIAATANNGAGIAGVASGVKLLSIKALDCTGAGLLSVVAPGERIVSTTPTYATWQSARGMTLNYGVMSGTSQAAPFVTGLAALILSANPTLTPAQVVDRIKATADDLGASGFDT